MLDCRRRSARILATNSVLREVVVVATVVRVFFRNDLAVSDALLQGLLVAVEILVQHDAIPQTRSLFNIVFLDCLPIDLLDLYGNVQ